jgi:hypothetical protein
MIGKIEVDGDALREPLQVEEDAMYQNRLCALGTFLLTIVCDDCIIPYHAYMFSLISHHMVSLIALSSR